MPNTLITFARQLRKNSTNVERILWRQLRSHRFYKLKFKRQQPIGPYIADFVCFDKRVIIELDGGQHDEQKEADEKRSVWLAEQGFKVVRFWNNDVLTNLEGVLFRIAEALSLHLDTDADPNSYPHPLPNPLPSRERE